MLSRLTSYVILPSQWLSKIYYYRYKKGRERLIKNFGGIEKTITTVDNVRLNCMLFKRKNTSSFLDFFKSKKIIINFMGLNGIYEKKGFSPNLIKTAHKLGFDLLLFNYRSVGKSQGIATQKGLIKDGKAVVDEAISLGYNDIYVNGHSLGGLIATKTIATCNFFKTKIVKLINDRSCSSIVDFIMSYKIFYIFNKIISFIIKWLDWNIDAAEAWKKITSKKALIHSKKDKLMRGVSLYLKVKDEKNAFHFDSYGHRGDLKEEDFKKVLSSLA